MYAAEAYSFDLVDMTGRLPDLLIGSILEATSGVTASHVYCLMLEVEKKGNGAWVVTDWALHGFCIQRAQCLINASNTHAIPSKKS